MSAERQLIAEYRRRIDALTDRVKSLRGENQSLRAEIESVRKLLHEAARQTDRDLALIRDQERLIRRLEGVRNVA